MFWMVSFFSSPLTEMSPCFLPIINKAIYEYHDMCSSLLDLMK